MIEFRPNDPKTYGTYQNLACCLKLGFERDCLAANIYKAVISISREMFLTIDHARERVSVDNKAILHEKCITKYGNAQRKRKRCEQKPAEVSFSDQPALY